MLEVPIAANRLTFLAVVACLLAGCTGVDRPPLLADNPRSAQMWLRAINSAEAMYTGQYKKGFACRLSDLGPPEGSAPADQHRAGLLDSSLTRGQKSGYTFELRCVTGGASYQVTAVPTVPGQAGKRAFCSDQTGTLRYADDGTAETCLKNGREVQ